MKKGLNCSIDYDPERIKKCLKCLSENNHHEYACKKYYRRSKYVCSACKRGFHFSDECEVSRSKSRERKN